MTEYIRIVQGSAHFTHFADSEKNAAKIHNMRTYQYLALSWK